MRTPFHKIKGTFSKSTLKQLHPKQAVRAVNKTLLSLKAKMLFNHIAKDHNDPREESRHPSHKNRLIYAFNQFGMIRDETAHYPKELSAAGIAFKMAKETPGRMIGTYNSQDHVISFFIEPRNSDEKQTLIEVFSTAFINPVSQKATRAVYAPQPRNVMEFYLSNTA